MAAKVALVRSASLNGYGELARSLGLDAAAMLRRAGLSPRSLQDPETPLSAEAVHCLLEASAEASGAQDFGLRLAARRQLSHLGPIALVLRAEPTARQALETLLRYLRLLNASLLTWIESRDGLLVIHEDMLGDARAPVRQSMELALGVMHRILSELLGARWQALGVCFRHAAPRDTAAHSAFFKTRVDFCAGRNAIVCRAADLDAPRALGQSASALSTPAVASDPLAPLARQFLDQALSRAHSSSRVAAQQLIAALLPGGRCTAQQVAQHLGQDRRTLHRHLAAEGQSFATVLQELRQTLALAQLRNGQRPLAEVASLLGFASASAFSHWFRSSFACSARDWRRSAQCAAGAQPALKPPAAPDASAAARRRTAR